MYKRGNDLSCIREKRECRSKTAFHTDLLIRGPVSRSCRNLDALGRVYSFLRISDGRGTRKIVIHDVLQQKNVPYADGPLRFLQFFYSTDSIVGQL